mmetsp:Transcript_21205/g.55302  ORF Transcript_21205/g.55302 Transcript_21205/m.55302 type:complete len:734 (+) Transcript_21205:388-2589(+)
MPRISTPVGVAIVTAVAIVVLMHQSESGKGDVTWLGGRAESTRPRRAVGSNGSPFDLPTNFSWTIFITPQAFVGEAEQVQRRAIMSWLRLTPRPRVVVLGIGERLEQVSAELGLEYSQELDLNLAQMPLSGSLLHHAAEYPTDVSVILNSDIILTQSFVDALAHVNGLFADWFMTGARLDLKELPQQFDPSRSAFSDVDFSAYARDHGMLHTAGGVDYFAWNNQRAGTRTKLIHGVMPPFIRGKSKFDNWLVHEVIQAGYRETVDATEAATVVHVAHGYQSADTSVQVGASDIKSGASFWMSNKGKDWQIYHNMNLAIEYGSYQNQDGTSVHAQYKLTMCLDRIGSHVCAQRRIRAGVCPCEHHVFALETQNDPTIVEVSRGSHRSQIVKCGAISSDNGKYKIPARPLAGREAVLGLPFTLKDLLPLVAKGNHVILTGVSYNYRDMLMNFVCNLRRLKIFDSLVIAAWDEDMYRWGFQMGLPIFYFQTDVAVDVGRDLAYGSKEFRKVTKLKSQVVLEILRMGYDVIWTDTDIAWLQNPLPKLAAMESDFVVQSNAPATEAAANGPLRINSGFYRIRSSPIAIAGLEAVVHHAANSRLTEQPSFYLVLCGGKDGKFKNGDDACIFKAPSRPGGYGETGETELVVQFLDRHHYPNGASAERSGRRRRYWDVSDIRGHSDKLVILHNNWIKGFASKVGRMVEHGLWYYARDDMVCRYEPDVRFQFHWASQYPDES